MGPACHTHTDSQATGSGLSHKHRKSSYWVRPVTQTQKVKLLGPACHPNTESETTGSGLSHKHRESSYWVRPVTQTQRVKELAGLVCFTESQGTGSGLSYKHSESTRHPVGPVIQTSGRRYHTSVDYVNCQ